MGLQGSGVVGYSCVSCVGGSTDILAIQELCSALGVKDETAHKQVAKLDPVSLKVWRVLWLQ